MGLVGERSGCVRRMRNCRCHLWTRGRARAPTRRLGFERMYSVSIDLIRTLVHAELARKIVRRSRRRRCRSRCRLLWRWCWCWCWRRGCCGALWGPTLCWRVQLQRAERRRRFGVQEAVVVGVGRAKDGSRPQHARRERLSARPMRVERAAQHVGRYLAVLGGVQVPRTARVREHFDATQPRHVRAHAVRPNPRRAGRQSTAPQTQVPAPHNTRRRSGSGRSQKKMHKKKKKGRAKNHSTDVRGAAERRSNQNSSCML